MKKKLVSIVAALLGALSTGSHSFAEEGMNGSVTTAFGTAYVAKNGVAFRRGPTSFNIIDVNIGSDVTLEAWSATALGSGPYGSTKGDEIDLFASWHHKLGDWKTTLAGGYFFIRDLESLENDVLIGEAEVAYEKHAGFQPYVSLRYFGPAGSKSPNNGWFGWLGVRGTYDIGVPKTALSVNLSGAYSDGALGRTPGAVFARIMVGLPIKLSTCVTLTPSVLFQMPLGDSGSHSVLFTDREEVVGSLALSVRF